jgi:hypothetical protein
MYLSEKIDARAELVYIPLFKQTVNLRSIRHAT